MQRTLKLFDLGQVRFEKIRLVVLSFEILGELGDVIDFDIVRGLVREATTRATPAIVVRGTRKGQRLPRVCPRRSSDRPVVELIFLLLGDGKLEEVLGERELMLDVSLRNAEVLDVEETDVVDSMLQLLR